MFWQKGQGGEAKTGLGSDISLQVLGEFGMPEVFIQGCTLYGVSPMILYENCFNTKSLNRHFDVSEKACSSWKFERKTEFECF